MDETQKQTGQNCMFKLLKSLSILVAVLVFGVAVYIYFVLAASEPLLNDEFPLQGLKHSASIERDANGIATVIAENRIDLARATGFLHAQERFFQMDLLRRNSAGELAALFGAAALPHDRKLRKHRFRHRARVALQVLSATDLAIITAYTDGVNQGLNGLHSKPFEYHILGQSPVNWTVEDTFLVVYSMYLDLQDGFGERDRSVTALKETFSDDAFQFIYSDGSRWDATIDGTDKPGTKIPDNFSFPESSNSAATISSLPPADLVPGSNNWAVSGDRTKYTAAMVADDMHLGFRTPNIWFRARFKYTQDNIEQDVSGVSLPGTPNIIVGSNGKVAWGFTNSYGNWSDVIALQMTGEQYLTADGLESVHTVEEVLSVANGQPETLIVRETRWGPIITEPDANTQLAYRWVAHDVEGVNLNIMGMEQVETVYDAIKVAATAGIPAQNMMLADADGNVAWTIAGAIPRKDRDYNPNVIVDWSSKQQGWNGYLSADEYPKVINPDSGRLWTANSRVVGGEMLEKIGDAGYALGARNQQIKDLLFAKEMFTEQDLLDIQLDNRAIFLTRWHDLLLNQVATITRHEQKETIVNALNKWTAKADASDLGYLLVRQFRLKVRENVFSAMESSVLNSHPDFDLGSVYNRFEPALWQLITIKPESAVPEGFASWNELLDVSLAQSLTELNEQFGDWRTLTWGEYNTSRIKHAMSDFVPLLGLLTDMPEAPQHGDSFMPRVGGPAFGASQRLVVAPGHEENGILHMPTSQSGHPFSPYYGNLHEDWLHGKATPLLPGETKYKLHLYKPW